MLAQFFRFLARSTGDLFQGFDSVGSPLALARISSALQGNNLVAFGSLPTTLLDTPNLVTRQAVQRLAVKGAHALERRLCLCSAQIFDRDGMGRVVMDGRMDGHGRTGTYAQRQKAGNGLAGIYLSGRITSLHLSNLFFSFIERLYG